MVDFYKKCRDICILEDYLQKSKEAFRFINLTHLLKITVSIYKKRIAYQDWESVVSSINHFTKETL